MAGIVKLESGKINNRQLAYLLLIMVISTADIYFPSIVAREAYRDSWISVILACLAALPLILLYHALARNFPGKNIIEYAPLITGKIPGLIINLLIWLFYIFTTAIILAELGDFVTWTFLPETPVTATILLTVAVASFTIKKGIEAIARLNEFLFWIGLSLLLFVAFATINRVNLEYMLPILENGFMPPIRGTLPLLSLTAEISVILVLFPFFSNYKNTLGVSLKVLLILFFLYQLGGLIVFIFSPNEVAMMKIATFELVQIISFGIFLQRFDTFIIAVWLSGVYVKICIFFYVSSLITAQIFNHSDYRYIVMPIASLLAILPLFMFRNATALVSFLAHIFPFFALIFQAIVPLILYIIFLIRKKAILSGIKT